MSLRSADAGFITHIDGTTTNLAFLWQVKRDDVAGTLHGLTAHQKDLPYDHGDGEGLITYTAMPGVRRKAIQTTADMSIDNLELEGAFHAAGIERVDFLAGRLDNARVKVYVVNYESLTDQGVHLFTGNLGEVRSGRDFSAELRDLVEGFFAEIVEETSAPCRAVYGGARCQVDLVGVPWSSGLVVTALVVGAAETATVVLPSSENDRWFICIVAGKTGTAEPSWNLTIDATTVETAAVWSDATSYPAGSLVLENGLLWESDGGTSAAPEPVWTGTPGDILADNGGFNWTAFTPAQWKTVQGRRINTEIDTITTNMDFTVTSATDAPDIFFTPGRVKFTSGNHSGDIFEIKSWTQSTKRVLLKDAPPLLLTDTDTLELLVGCDKLRASCVGFDNIWNIQAEPDTPGLKRGFRTPDAPPV